MRFHFGLRIASITLALFCSRNLVEADSKFLGQRGYFKKWSKIEVDFFGPQMDGTSREENPFRVEVNVRLHRPDGTAVVVPAFYAGDGNRGQSGNVWRLRFSADARGMWSFRTLSDVEALDGYFGWFGVMPLEGTEAGFYRLGRLVPVVGRYYLKFADGPFWIKSGSNDPENFLGSPFGDSSLTFKRTIVDYLVSKGINAQYMLSHNLDGDHRDTWPWLGETASEAKANDDLFDVAKLEMWEEILSYMQSSGVVPHLVLEDDSSWSEYNRPLYYRELVARFGHHPALIWNIGEEYDENYNVSEVIEHARLLRELDPYAHPLTVHSRSLENWEPLFGKEYFDLTSLQRDGFSPLISFTISDMNSSTIDLRQAVADQGKIIPVCWDETPRATENSGATRSKFRRKIVWPIYLAGGNFEFHYSSTDLDYWDLDLFWEDLSHAREFVELGDFAKMHPDNTLVDNGLCLAREGRTYMIYLDEDEAIPVHLELARGNYNTLWYDPRSGNSFHAGQVNGPGKALLTPPTGLAAGDWAILVERTPRQVNGFRRGDCLRDDDIGISDVLYSLGYLFRNASRPSCREACDVNGDSTLDPSDPVFQLRYLFSGGRAPEPPFPDCEGDPEPERSLGCAAALCPL